MTTAKRGFSVGPYEANQDVFAFLLPFGFRPKTSAVPVLPLIATGKPLNTPAAVPLITTSRKALCRNLIVSFVAGIGEHQSNERKNTKSDREKNGRHDC